MARNPARRLSALEKRLPVRALAPGPTLWDELAKIRDHEARDLITTACKVLFDPATDDHQRSLAARWSSVEYSEDLCVGDLQAMVSFTLPWPDFWPPEHKIVRTVYDWCDQMQARPGAAGSPDGSVR